MIFGLAASALVALGLYGLVTQAALLRKVLSFNLLGGGVFLVFGVVARRGSMVDAVPQALVITGLVVAFAATALAIVLVLRLHQRAGTVTISEDPPA